MPNSKLIVSVDSGAHSFYNAFHKGKHKTQQQTFHKTPEFKKYLDNYIEFLSKYKDRLGVYITLDVIGNAKATWDILKYMESYGLSPMPVFHRTSDFKWFFKLMDNYDYIGVGGLGQTSSYSSYKNYGDLLFKNVVGNDGRPKVKIHGLAMTGRYNILRYPWYSFDSASWVRNAYVGSLAIPDLRLDAPTNWGHFHWMAVTDRRLKDKRHILYQPPVVQRLITKYLKSVVGSVEALGLSTSEGLSFRGLVNLITFLQFGLFVKAEIKSKWGFDGGNLLLAGNCLIRHGTTTMPLLLKQWADTVHIFETFFYCKSERSWISLFERADDLISPNRRIRLRHGTDKSGRA